ncbi:MAG: hypothetical protein OEY09_03100 [Gammaproteobacteria bacterium]|nr:hypothetical protein [Gammaproteobacteria bacterium]
MLTVTGLNSASATNGINLIGFGVEYENLVSAFGSVDDLSVTSRIAPGFSWKVNNQLSFGVSSLLTYADLEQRVFPNTSFNNTVDPSRSFLSSIGKI